MKTKHLFAVVLSVIVGFSLMLVACSKSPETASEIAQKREAIRSMAASTLSTLYKTNPAAQEAIVNSAGYAVFSDFGMKVMFMGGAQGQGVAVNNATDEETFMKMVELQPGLGLGAQNFRVVFVFESREAFNKFVTSGWEFGADMVASAKTKSMGGGLAGAVPLSDDVYMYQLNKEGAIVGVSITGAKYYKYSELN